MKLTFEQIIKATGGRTAAVGSASYVTGVAIDSRQIKPSELYIAIRGPHFDGHDFVADCIRLGAAGVVVAKGSKYESPQGVWVIEVDDTVAALGDIAAYWRTTKKCLCVAVTGSNGKSTTKEMLSAGLSETKRVIKTEGNFNNLIGLPLQVLRLTDDVDVAVFEMGMNAAGEIKRLAEIVAPDVGIITNVNPAHLEKLHTVENVAKAKGELFEAMSDDSLIVVNAEDPWCVRLAEKFKGRKISFGMQNDCDVRFGHMISEGLEKSDITFWVGGREFSASIPVPGVHNVMNALAAFAAGHALGVKVITMIPGIEKFSPMKMRFERVQLLNGVQLINDCYNANPSSMQAAFRTVSAAKRSGRFIAVLGEMLELGDAAAEKHEELGRNAVLAGASKIFAAGPSAEIVKKGALLAGMKRDSIVTASTSDELKEVVMAEAATGDIVLIKGSRGMKMERIAEHLKNRIGV